MSEFSIQQNIPVADHVYKYLIARCGKKPFLASRNTFIGSTVLSLLVRNEDIQHNIKSKYVKCFSVTINERQTLRNGFFISQKNAHLFNNLIDRMFRDELFCHVIMNKSQHKNQYMESIRSFLSIYNITEDDIKFETILRDFKRKKSSIIKSHQLSNAS